MSDIGSQASRPSSPMLTRSVSAEEKRAARELLRLLKILSSAGASGCSSHWLEGGTQVRLTMGARHLTVTKDTISNAGDQGLILGRDKFLITELGKDRMVRLLHPLDGFQEQHLNTRITQTRTKSGFKNVRVTDSESPLARLRQRAGKSKGVAIGDFEFEAGERLRRDFEKAGLRQSITSNWSLSGTGGKNTGGGNGGLLQDFALDAKRRFNSAISALGPELRGVAVDVCCFLKGLEEVEFERQWPKRSARVMLKASLSALARHYGYPQNE